MGSHAAFVYINSPFCYTDDGSRKPASEATTEPRPGKSRPASSGTDCAPGSTVERPRKQPPQDGPGRRPKRGLLSGLLGKRNRKKSIPPGNLNDYPGYDSSGAAGSRQGRSTPTVGREVGPEAPRRGPAGGEDGVSPGEHMYSCPPDAQVRPDHVYESAENRCRGSPPPGAPAATRGRLWYAAIEPPAESAAVSAGSSPAKTAPLGREDEMYDIVEPVRRAPDERGEVYSQIAERREPYYVDSEDEVYEEIVIGSRSAETDADPYGDEDGLCTDSGDYWTASVQSLHLDRRLKIEQKAVCPLDVCRQGFTPGDGDEGYVTTAAVSTSKRAQPKPRPRPRSKPPIPAPRSHPAAVPRGSNPKIPPQPANKPPGPRAPATREVTLLADQARRLLRTSRGSTGGPSALAAVAGVDFTARLLDEAGGRLRLRHHGVSLDVPPGALSGPELVYIHVQRDLQASPVGEEEGFASPIVDCGSPGLRFKTPVFLSFPVQLQDPSAWEFRGIQQQSPEQPWEEISSGSCPDSQVVVKDGLCTAVVDHFTLFGLSARPRTLRGAAPVDGDGDGSREASRPLRVGVFLPSDRTTTSGHVQMRVRVWAAECRETSQQVQTEERGSRLVDRTCTFFLHTSEEGAGCRQPGLDVSVDVRGFDDGLWKPDPTKEVIAYENFHSDPRGRVDESVTFNMALQSPDGEGGLRPLLCDFVISQRAHPRLTRTIRAVVDVHHGASMRVEPAGPAWRPMSDVGFRRLRDYLDRESRWKLLADACFGGAAGGCTFERWPCPSTAVLGAIFARSAARDARSAARDARSAALRDLCRTLQSERCHLRGAAQIVREDMSPGESVDSTAPGELKHPVQCSDGRSKYENWSGRDAEENDEEPSRVHTLRYADHPAQPATPSRRPLGPKVPTQQEWPPRAPAGARQRLAPSHGALRSDDDDDDDDDGARDGGSRNSAAGARGSACAEEGQYSTCPVIKVAGSREEQERALWDRYQNTDAFFKKRSEPLLKGYCKFEKKE